MISLFWRHLDRRGTVASLPVLVWVMEDHDFRGHGERSQRESGEEAHVYRNRKLEKYSQKMRTFNVGASSSSSSSATASLGVSRFQDTPYYWVFRIVHAPVFLPSFACDRRHLKDSAGNWVSPPREDGTAHNLNEYIEMCSVDVVKSIGPDTLDAVLTKNLGDMCSVDVMKRIGPDTLDAALT